VVSYSCSSRRPRASRVPSHLYKEICDTNLRQQTCASAIGRTSRLWGWNLDSSKCQCTAGTVPIRHRHQLDGRNVWEVKRRFSKKDLFVFVQVHLALPQQTVLDVVIPGLTRQGPTASDQNFTSTRSHKPVLIPSLSLPPQRHGAERRLSTAGDIGSY
jgi:hypothetical protein